MSFLPVRKLVFVFTRLSGQGSSKLLGIAQPEVSPLVNGHYSRFTADKRPDFLKRLDRTVSLQISPHRPGEPYQQVAIAT